MRITGGKYLRRQVICPPGVIRPAMDRMRESLFSILGDLTGTSFLDLFSGSGCMAIEAASRGASPIHLVEMDRGKKATIEKNLSYVEENKKLFIQDAYRFIMSTPFKYDIVYADPPFPMEGKVKLLETVNKYDILKENGLFIIHYPAEEKSQWPEKLDNYTFIDERKYGRSLLRFYKKENKNANN